VRYIDDLPPSLWDSVIGSNLDATYLCCRAAMPALRKAEHGRIVNFSSSLATGSAMWPSTVGARLAYCAAKGGIDMLVRSLASEWGPHGIRVNAFNPGYTNHSMTDKGQAFLAEASKDIVARTPLRRMAEMKEMVGPAVFLASDAASFVTGTILLADGGWCAQ